MKLVNLIILDPAEVTSAGDVTLTGARAAHLADVLKVTPGQTVRVGLLDGPLGAAVVTATDGRRVAMRCTFDGDAPPRPRVDLLLALPRPKVMRRLWPQLAALGVGQIILTNAERVERNYFDTHVLAPDCYRPLLVEGLQQARDTRLPTVSMHRQFRILVEDHLDTLFAGVRLVADPRAGASITDTLRGMQGDRILIAIGAEGGWNDFERQLLEGRGFQPVGLGPRTLRADTACVALVTLVHEALRAGGAPVAR
jgi:RsmE family RNA methyltransferase